MEELRRRRKLKKKLYSKPTMAILFILVILLIAPTWRIWRTNIESKRNLERAKQELAELEKTQKELETEVALLQTDKGKEQEIRKKFSVRKEGEEVVLLIDEKASTSDESTEENRGFFGRIWHAIISFLKN